MTGSARGRIRIASLGSAAVDARHEVGDFFLVAFGALGGCELCRGNYFMDASVAGRTGLVAQSRVNAVGHGRGFFSVARGAVDFGDFRWVWKLLNAGVAILAPENSMRASGMSLGANGYIVALFRFHACLPVTGEASFILLQRVRGRLLGLNGKRIETEGKEGTRKRQRNKKRANELQRPI